MGGGFRRQRPAGARSDRVLASLVTMHRKPHDVPSRDERRSVGRLALVLWLGVCVVLAAVAVPTLGAAIDGDTGASAPPDRAMERPANATTERGGPAEPRTERTEGIVERFFPDATFSFDFDRGSGLDFRVGTGSVDVRLLDLGGDDGRQTGTISHGAIDGGVARSSGAGLCAAGLRETDSPLAVDVDAGNSSVTADLASEPAGNPNRTAAIDPGAIVRSCANATA